MRNAAHAVLALLLTAMLAACGGGGGGSDGDKDQGTTGRDDTQTAPAPSDSANVVNPPPATPPGNTPPHDDTPPGDDDDTPPGNAQGFTTTSDAAWDETAVRKVLHVFAFGGQATDAQIALWADMPPEEAIVEMLTFDEHNLKLSPPDADRLDTRDGTLYGLSDFWTSDDPANGVPVDRREVFGIKERLGELWAKAATSRGLNPFRHRIGLWETNYHLAVNLDAGVNKPQIARYYEDILATLASGASYDDVLTTAALSAAVATQYGHRTNRWRNGVCDCNEDFAREYFQLFFGILGMDDPDYHETVDIKNMARVLTDMAVPSEDSHLLDYVVFGTAKHYPGPLEIMGEDVYGSTAAERVAALSPRAIEHPESLAFLPVKIVSDLADDAMTEEKAAIIRGAWASMQKKSLLDFIRAYALSTLFHDDGRTKLWTSVERHLILTNAVTVSNKEGDLNLFDVDRFERDGVEVFRPAHNVFGGQTGREAADTSDVFRNQLNHVTDDEYRYRRGQADVFGEHWTKDWSHLVPRGPNGYVVRDVAEWLWQRIVADGLRNFHTLERAYVYALLATKSDFNSLADPDDLERAFTSEEIESDDGLSALLNDLADDEVLLDSADPAVRLDAHERLGHAFNFIAGTPYVFAQEGR